MIGKQGSGPVVQREDLFEYIPARDERYGSLRPGPEQHVIDMFVGKDRSEPHSLHENLEGEFARIDIDVAGENEGSLRTELPQVQGQFHDLPDPYQTVAIGRVRRLEVGIGDMHHPRRRLHIDDDHALARVPIRVPR